MSVEHWRQLQRYAPPVKNFWLRHWSNAKMTENCVIGLPFYIGKTLSYTQQFKSRSRDCNCWGTPSLKGPEIPNYEYFYNTAITLIRSIGPKGASSHCQIWCFCPPCITIILKYNTPLATPLTRDFALFRNSTVSFCEKFAGINEFQPQKFTY